MATTINNLEKLIQMATIEQMYNMLQKLKADNSSTIKECNFSDETHSNENNALIGSLLTEIKHLKTEINDHNEKLQRYNIEFWKLSETIKYLSLKSEQLENELSEIKSNTNNNSRFLCQQIRGQQSLTSYPGFSNGSPNEKVDEAHIKLKIEEKLYNKVGDNTDEDYNSCDEEEDINPAMITCATITLDVKPVIEDVHKDDPIADTSEEESEEEFETEDETEFLAKEAKIVIEYIEEKDEEVEDEEVEEEEVEDEEVEEEEVEDEEVEKEEVEKEEVEEVEKEEVEDEEAEDEEVEEEETEEEEVEEEEEEEVFEIEIDDVTYFATDEENGILYEMTSDGDIGKKVGIIKDGEPIFN
jgi:hypothetical protein